MTETPRPPVTLTPARLALESEAAKCRVAADLPEFAGTIADGYRQYAELMESAAEHIDALTAEVAAANEMAGFWQMAHTEQDIALKLAEAELQQANTVAGDAHAEIERLVAHILVLEKDWREPAQAQKDQQYDENVSVNSKIARLEADLQQAQADLKAAREALRSEIEGRRDR